MKSSLKSQLLPIDEFEIGFSTSSSIEHACVLKCPLDDKALGVHKVASRLKHPIVRPPEATAPCSLAPSLAWEAFYPEGSINPSGTIPGGLSFYLYGPPEFKARLATATEAVMSYRMMLQQDWEWVKGGKLPGLCELTLRD